ncbi:MAG: hypothetical protein B7Z08_01410 [Sphingomonadales bacterium 32-68-7]|nr:MAG: hypothetical protein B7Z33_08745 [Sphingomonadales bacterium 12-68-11]OYX10375.1 MAG: hypothetical protein B7Z08_01410 [Sphingomonadales bacterium 32-68-7]
MREIDTLSGDDALFAAELALGLLEGEAAREALRRAAQDPAFAREAARWHRLLDRWLEQAPSDAPPAGLLEKIELHIGDSPAAGFSMRPAPPVHRWKAVAFTSIAASLALCGALALSLGGTFRTEQAPAFAGGVAQITDTSGAPLLSAVYDNGSGRLSLRVADVAAASLVPELWVIPEGGSPRSLGLIGAHSVTIELTDELRALLIDGATMAITLEPPAGAPHGAPTGDVLGTGKLQTVVDRSAS